MSGRTRVRRLESEAAVIPFYPDGAGSHVSGTSPTALPRLNGIAERSAKRKRFPLEIVVDILRAASGEGASVTSLGYKSNTNFLRLSRYIELLSAGNLLECIGSTPRLYRTTARGEEAGITLTFAHELIFGNGLARLPPASSKVKTPVATALRDESNLREVRKSFANLSPICKFRNGARCRIRCGECTLESCLLFLPSG